MIFSPASKGEWFLVQRRSESAKCCCSSESRKSMLVPLQTQNHFANPVALDLVGAPEDRDLAQVEVVRGQRRRVVVAVHGVVGPAVQVGRIESQARGAGGFELQLADLLGDLRAPNLQERGLGADLAAGAI